MSPGGRCRVCKSLRTPGAHAAAVHLETRLCMWCLAVWLQGVALSCRCRQGPRHRHAVSSAPLSPIADAGIRLLDKSWEYAALGRTRGVGSSRCCISDASGKSRSADGVCQGCSSESRDWKLL